MGLRAWGEGVVLLVVEENKFLMIQSLFLCLGVDDFLVLWLLFYDPSDKGRARLSQDMAYKRKF